MSRSKGDSLGTQPQSTTRVSAYHHRSGTEWTATLCTDHRSTTIEAHRTTAQHDAAQRDAAQRNSTQRSAMQHAAAHQNAKATEEMWSAKMAERR